VPIVCNKMPRIRTAELLDVLARNAFTVIKLKGLQNGTFCMMIETADGSFIHENSDGNIKEYPKADNALGWLKRKARINEVLVDLEIWKADQTQ
jgi:hypothetical protein